MTDIHENPEELDEESYWTSWPEEVGEQMFIHYKGRTWVGHVEEIVGDDVTLLVWCERGQIIINHSDYQGGFWFKKIDWPGDPE